LYIILQKGGNTVKINTNEPYTHLEERPSFNDNPLEPIPKPPLWWE